MMTKTMMMGILFLASFASAGIYSGGGSGTADNPYQISTPADWQILMSTPQDWDKHFKLTGPLDLAGVTLTPIGNSTTKFTGVFRGDGWTISNAVISQPGSDNVGLFGYIWGEAEICDLHVENASVEGRFGVGGLVGRLDSATIMACSWNGTVKGVSLVGGIAGCCTLQSAFLGCWSMGTVTGSRYVGGLVGYLWGGTLYYCYSQASVIGVIDTTGGPNEVLGGLIGWMFSSNSLAAKCYAAGIVQRPSISIPNVGGLVGLNDGSIVADSFWDMQVSGESTSAGGIGKTTAQMKQSTTYISAGWDFVNIWELGEHQTYPYIRSRPSADLNRDGVVALEDFSILAEQWLTEDIQAPSELNV
ncbi:MAG: hypothetical protein KBI46_01285 [Phycisphaerae bacterium]|nr:hypothetical protein [Phycisphaerae bacterium]